MEMVVRSVLFAAVGTMGQRCTTARRLVCMSMLHGYDIIILWQEIFEASNFHGFHELSDDLNISCPLDYSRLSS